MASSMSFGLPVGFFTGVSALHEARVGSVFAPAVFANVLPTFCPFDFLLHFSTFVKTPDRTIPTIERLVEDRSMWRNLVKDVKTVNC